MQFKVPQNIDMEDRIIGPLTLTQFFYLLFGGVIIYILFGKLAINGYGFLFWVLAIPIGTLSFAMAFVKIQDRPFPSFFYAFIRYLVTPRARIWQHDTSEQKVQKPKPKTPTQPITPKKSFDTVRVNELADIMDKDLPRKGE